MENDPERVERMEGGSCTRAPLPTPGVLAQAPRGARLFVFEKQLPCGCGRSILDHPRRAAHRVRRLIASDESPLTVRSRVD